jgi:hypothetical protein
MTREEQLYAAHYAEREEIRARYAALIDESWAHYRWLIAEYMANDGVLDAQEQLDLGREADRVHLVAAGLEADMMREIEAAHERLRVRLHTESST